MNRSCLFIGGPLDGLFRGVPHNRSFAAGWSRDKRDWVNYRGISVWLRDSPIAVTVFCVVSMTYYEVLSEAEKHAEALRTP